jgi:hypothetical protein
MRCRGNGKFITSRSHFVPSRNGPLRVTVLVPSSSIRAGHSASIRTGSASDLRSAGGRPPSSRHRGVSIRSTIVLPASIAMLISRTVGFLHGA